MAEADSDGGASGAPVDIGEALRASEERYRTLFEQAPLGVFLYDESLRLYACNARFAEILQSTHERLVGLDLTKLRDQAVVPALRRAIEGSPATYEGGYSATTSSAKIVISMRLSPLRDGKGNIIGGMGVVEDVTEMRRAEAAVRQLERRREAHMRRTPLAVIDFNIEGVIVEWNSAAERIFGFKRDEVIGKSAALVLVPDCAREEINGVWQALLTSSGGERTTNQNRTKDGRLILCDWYNTGLVNEAGETIGVASLVEDITERKAAEDALKRSEARFRALIERAPDAIGVLRGARFVFANPALAELLGYGDPSELVGTEVGRSIHPEDHAIMEARRVELEAGASLPPYEYRMLRKDGTAVTVEVVSLTLEYDGMPAVVSLARDVSERRLMQARLLQADRMASVGTLAAGVAHEINNPLAYLMANLDVVGRRKLPQLAARIAVVEERIAELKPEGIAPGELSERISLIDEMLGIAREGAERVRNIVRDLKTFSRTDDEKEGPVDVRRVMDASINIAWNEIRHRARLERLYDDVPLVDGNESRIGQVFLNLLVNAAHALPVGSANDNTITVRTTTDTAGRVVVEVSDTGSGIPAALVGRIFDPFFTTKPIGVGTGLGLWICQGIVSGLGGEILALSEPGKGATFRVSLPPSRETSRADLQAQASPAREPARRGRILVVDDESALASALKTQLSDEHEVVAVRSGREALDLLREDTGFDLILCDLLMPDVTGMDVFEEVVRERPWLRERFVFMTGGAFTTRARDFLDAVENTTLEKPFEVDRVRALIRRS